MVTSNHRGHHGPIPNTFIRLRRDEKKNGQRNEERFSREKRHWMGPDHSEYRVRCIIVALVWLSVDTAATAPGPEGSTKSLFDTVSTQSNLSEQEPSDKNSA